MTLPALIGVAVSMALPATALAQRLSLVPLDARVPRLPAPFVAEGRQHLLYELRVTNLGRADRAIQRLDVLQGNAIVASWSGDSLTAIAIRMGEAPGGDARRLNAGRQVLVHLMVSLAPDRAARELTHRFLLTHPDSLSGPPRDTLVGPVIAAGPAPPVLSPPFKGGVWLAANGPGNASGHRRTAVPIGGQARIAQRLAIDWVKVGPDGRLWQGDSTRNENWHGYREPLLAVAEGTVVDIKDGIPENTPLTPQRAVEITLETIGGNYVIIDIGGGRYAFYAHLVPGSLTVMVGDRVRTGQVIGLLGNSGNSDAPHLHFHLSDAPSPLGSEGIPYMIDRYEKLGQTGPMFMRGFSGPGTPEPRRGELPLQNHVVRFP